MSKKKPNDEEEGWESLAEEPSAGTIQPSEELEQAMREAAEAIEEHRTRPPAPDRGRPRGTELAEVGEIDPASSAGAEATAEEGAPDADTELAQVKERLVRLAADFENFRRRALKDREEAHAFGHQNLVKDLLPTVDNLERAIDHAAQSEDGDLPGLLRGVELVLRELQGVLAKHGVTEIEAAAQPFDPAVHEAMAQAPDASVPPNTVVQVFQKGYQLRNRLLRPARVVVSCPPENAEPAADEKKQED